MLKIKSKDGWLPIINLQNYFVEDNEEGNQTLQFDIPLKDDVHPLVKPKALIEGEGNLWLVTQINQLTSYATVTCDLDMDEWYAGHYVKSANVEQLQTKLIGDILNYIKPSGWTILNAGARTIKRTPNLEKCNNYDILMSCKTLFDVQYDFNSLLKTVTIVDPNLVTDNGLYITPELNMSGLAYKGDSKALVTRLYCYGADDMTFSDINNGKPYIDDFTYSDKVICDTWTDGRYTNIESLLEDGKKKLKEMATPTSAYTINVVDLASIDGRYKNLTINLRESAQCVIDLDKGTKITHKVIKRRRYPDTPDKNVITLSNIPRSLEKQWGALKENVQSVTKAGYRNETEIRQTNKEVEIVAKETEENTKGVKEVKQKITPEQMLITISDSINAGNKLNTMQVIIDLLGLTVKNGGIRVYDGDNNLVFYVDEKTKKLVFAGDITGGSIKGNTSIDVGTDLYVGDNIYLGDQKSGDRKAISLSDDVKILLDDYAIQLKFKEQSLVIREDAATIYANRFDVRGEGITLMSLTETLATFFQDVITHGDLYANKNAIVVGNFSCLGEKSRIVKTKNHGSRKLNAVESAGCYFEDFGIIKLNNLGTAVVYFNPIWLETVNTQESYYVSVTKCGLGDVFVAEKHHDCFTLKGTPGLTVDWRVTALQLGYENTRLEKYEEGDMNG